MVVTDESDVMRVGDLLVKGLEPVVNKCSKYRVTARYLSAYLSGNFFKSSSNRYLYLVLNVLTIDSYFHTKTDLL